MRTFFNHPVFQKTYKVIVTLLIVVLVAHKLFLDL